LNLTKEDPKRIGDILIDYLKEIIFFKTGKFWYNENIFPDIEISSRQKQRAEEALLKGESFWDRVGNNIIIPLYSSVLIMENVSRNLDINCEGVILKLLKDAILFKLSETKKSLLYSTEGETPEYLTRSINQLITDKTPSTIIYIEKEKNFNEHETENFLKTLFPKKELQHTGADNNSEWWIVYKINPYEIQRAIKQFNNVTTPKKSINRLIIRPLSDYIESADDFLINFNYIRNIARLLNLRITSLDNLGEFLKIFDIDIRSNKSLLGFIAPCIKLEETLKKIKEPFFITILNNCKNIQDINDSYIFDEKINISEKQFFLIKKFTEPLDNDTISSYTDKIKSFCMGSATAGMVFYPKKPLKNHSFLMDIFAAFIHAKLTGEGAVIFFDHTTLNIMGDEYYSLGDLKNAILSYKKAHELNSNDLRVINSLGASFAEIGYKSYGERLLLKGLKINGNDPSILYNLSGIYISMGKNSDAEKLMETLYELNPEDTPIMVRYAEALVNLKKFDIAKKILSPLFNEKRDDIPLSAYKIMANALYNDDKNWKKSRDLLNLALKKNPFDLEPYLLLARGYIEKENDPYTAGLFLEKLDFEKIKNPAMQILYKKLKKK